MYTMNTTNSNCLKKKCTSNKYLLCFLTCPICLDHFWLIIISTPEPLLLPFSASVQKLSIFSLCLIIKCPSFSRMFISNIPIMSYSSSSNLSTKISSLCLFPFKPLILCATILILFLTSIAFIFSLIWFIFCSAPFCCISFPSCTKRAFCNSTGAKVRSDLGILCPKLPVFLLNFALDELYTLEIYCYFCDSYTCLLFLLRCIYFLFCSCCFSLYVYFLF